MHDAFKVRQPEATLLATPAIPQLPPTDEDAAAEIRAKVIGSRRSIRQIAAAHKVTERAVYQQIQKYKIPYIRILRTRYLEPEDWRRAVVIESNAPPRSPGRPRKLRP